LMILYSIRSERQLMEQMNYPRNRSWFIFELIMYFGPQVVAAMDDFNILVRCGAVPTILRPQS